MRRSAHFFWTILLSSYASAAFATDVSQYTVVVSVLGNETSLLHLETIKYPKSYWLSAGQGGQGF